MAIMRTISQEKRRQLEKAVQFARNSVRLEGFILNPYLHIVDAKSLIHVVERAVP